MVVTMNVKYCIPRHMVLWHTGGGSIGLLFRKEEIIKTKPPSWLVPHQNKILLIAGRLPPPVAYMTSS
jgi:hypothetical protein